MQFVFFCQVAGPSLRSLERPWEVHYMKTFSLFLNVASTRMLVYNHLLFSDMSKIVTQVL